MDGTSAAVTAAAVADLAPWAVDFVDAITRALRAADNTKSAISDLLELGDPSVPLAALVLAFSGGPATPARTDDVAVMALVRALEFVIIGDGARLLPRHARGVLENGTRAWDLTARRLASARELLTLNTGVYPFPDDSLVGLDLKIAHWIAVDEEGLGKFLTSPLSDTIDAVVAFAERHSRVGQAVIPRGRLIVLAAIDGLIVVPGSVADESPATVNKVEIERETLADDPGVFVLRVKEETSLFAKRNRPPGVTSFQLFDEDFLLGVASTFATFVLRQASEAFTGDPDDELLGWGAREARLLTWSTEALNVARALVAVVEHSEELGFVCSWTQKMFDAWIGQWVEVGEELSLLGGFVVHAFAGWLRCIHSQFGNSVFDVGARKVWAAHAYHEQLAEALHAADSVSRGGAGLQSSRDAFVFIAPLVFMWIRDVSSGNRSLSVVRDSNGIAGAFARVRFDASPDELMDILREAVLAEDLDVPDGTRAQTCVGEATGAVGAGQAGDSDDSESGEIFFRDVSSRDFDKKNGANAHRMIDQRIRTRARVGHTVTCPRARPHRVFDGKRAHGIFMAWQLGTPPPDKLPPEAATPLVAFLGGLFAGSDGVRGTHEYATWARDPARTSLYSILAFDAAWIGLAVLGARWPQHRDRTALLYGIALFMGAIPRCMGARADAWTHGYIPLAHDLDAVEDAISSIIVDARRRFFEAPRKRHKGLRARFRELYPDVSILDLVGRVQMRLVALSPFAVDDIFTAASDATREPPELALLDLAIALDSHVTDSSGASPPQMGATTAAWMEMWRVEPPIDLIIPYVVPVDTVPVILSGAPPERATREGSSWERRKPGVQRRASSLPNDTAKKLMWRKPRDGVWPW